MTIKKEEVVCLGIVLKTQSYKESDALVTVYFKDYGKMTLIARGVKKLKSKNAAACQSLLLSHVMDFQLLLKQVRLISIAILKKISN